MTLKKYKINIKVRSEKIIEVCSKNSNQAIILAKNIVKKNDFFNGKDIKTTNKKAIFQILDIKKLGEFVENNTCDKCKYYSDSLRKCNFPYIRKVLNNE